MYLYFIRSLSKLKFFRFCLHYATLSEKIEKKSKLNIKLYPPTLTFLHPNRTPTSRNNSGSSSNSISQTSQSKNQTFQQKQKQKIYPDSNVLFDSRLLDTPTSSPISSQENNNETKSSDDSVVRRRQSSRKVQKQYLSSKGDNNWKIKIYDKQKNKCNKFIKTWKEFPFISSKLIFVFRNSR